jgi:hypothetical protein
VNVPLPAAGYDRSGSGDHHVTTASSNGVQVEQAEKMALAGLCTELAGLREESGRQPERVQHLLARIEEAARAREPLLSLLAELLGTPAAARGLSAGLPGAGAGHADEEWFGCPDGACDRRSQAVPAGPVPRCLVLDRPMKRR